MTDLIVVIGAGAAGIAAARRLRDAGRPALLVEASDRIGGRARTVDLGGYPIDLGCGWLHSATRNPWTVIAERGGFTVDRASPRWREQWHDLGFPRAEQQAFAAAWARWEDAARAALNGPDRALDSFIPADHPWRPLIDAISGYANGANLAAVSLHDWAAYEDAAGVENWAVREGYGALVAHHAAGVPLRLNTPVTRIDHCGRTLRLDTPAGTIEAAHAIVAVPTPVLAAGRLTFDPSLPAKRDAAAALPLGLADKAILRTAEQPWPAHSHLLGDPHTAHTASYSLSPFGRPIVEAFFGGDCAEALEGADAAAFAIDELAGLLGSDWRRKLTPLAVTRWRQERWIGGSYSHARIGRAAERAVLAAPVDGRLYFAGEACHAHDFSTAHGAYATGIAAAEALLAG